MIAAVLGLLVIYAAPVHAQSWRLEAAVGFAYNLPLPLVVEQSGAEPIHMRARFATRAFRQPLYYVVRLERGDGNGSWGVELIHHKLYLRNPPSEIQRFQVSHGFNVLSVLRGAGQHPDAPYRFGLGVVVSHPENTVRGRKLEEKGGIFDGYHLSGPAAQFAPAVRQRISGNFSAVLEAKLIGAYARVPIVDGSARFWHLSAHTVAGAGQSFQH